MTYLLGLTGGIATGKSTVAALFKRAGFPVVDADVIAREVVLPGKPALAEIKAAFGADVIRPDGSLDRKALGDLVFADKQALSRLNAIDAPYLKAALTSELENSRQGSAKIAIGELPLLYEGGYEQLFDGVVLVTLPPDVQLERLMARDDLTKAQAQQRIDAQMPLADKIARADFLIDNADGEASRRQQVSELITQLTDKIE